MQYAAAAAAAATRSTDDIHNHSRRHLAHNLHNVTGYQHNRLEHDVVDGNVSAHLAQLYKGPEPGGGNIILATQKVYE